MRRLLHNIFKRYKEECKENLIGVVDSYIDHGSLGINYVIFTFSCNKNNIAARLYRRISCSYIANCLLQLIIKFMSYCSLLPEPAGVSIHKLGWLRSISENHF